MTVDFIPINFNDLNDCAILAKWFNDPDIGYLISPNFNPHLHRNVTPHYIQQVNAYPKYEKYAYFVVCNGTIVGDINIVDNPDYLMKTNENSCWLGITIGEADYQGKGIGKKAMYFIEDLAYDLGYKRIELGVFSFNTRAIEFYKKLNYKPIGKVPNFTYYQGKWHDDLRFEKNI